MGNYDFLIVGAGLFGSVFAYEATKKNKRCLVIEKRNHIGGNCYTENIEGIEVHKYGAHIFRTSNKEIWDYIRNFSEFNHFINSPIANYKGEIYNLPFNMNTFNKMWGVITPAEAKKKIAEQCSQISTPADNLEDHIISLVGTDVYEKLVKGYTEKQWGHKCCELPPSIMRRLPVRFTYDNNYFNDIYQGIPIEGYTAIISKMLHGCDVELNVDFNKYKNKYLVDLNMAYNGTDRFGKDNNFGFFPALAIGYAISQEDFFKNVDWLGRNVQLLKFRTSYGLVGSDVASGDRYLYRQVYKTGDSYTFGEGNNFGVSGIKEGDLGNLNVTWEKARKFNVGVDMNLFDKFSLTFDWFIDKRYDQLVTRNDIPDILGIGLSPENVAETTNKGFDGQIGYQDRFGNFNFNTNFVFGYAKNRVDYKAEAQQKYEWLRETGRQIGQPFGYHWIGYYTPEDIEKINSGAADAPAKPDIAVQAGDLKYADLNGDGTINDFDKRAIGKPNLPTTTLGWTIGGSWKGFSISVLFQGSFDYSFAINGTGIESGKSQFQPLHQKCWTQERYENGESIEFPRLTMQDGTINSASAYNSDFWLINAWYIRLKTVDLGYQLPKTALPKFLDNVRFYVNAYNLLTFTGYDKYQQDPEIKTNTAGDAYMNQRVINFGVQLGF